MISSLVSEGFLTLFHFCTVYQDLWDVKMVGKNKKAAVGSAGKKKGGPGGSAGKKQPAEKRMKTVNSNQIPRMKVRTAQCLKLNVKCRPPWPAGLWMRIRIHFPSWIQIQERKKC